jgi:GT2 family glycosyltransferase
VRVSAVIVAYNSGPALVRCLESLEDERRLGTELEAIVVNNGPEAEEVAGARAFDFVRVISPGRNVGYAAGSNIGAEAAEGELLLFLNPDTVVSEGAIAELAACVDDSAVAMAMPRLLLYRQPDTLNSAGAAVHISGMGWSTGYGRPAAELTELREITYANGSVLAVRRSRFEELGGFTPELFLYHEDLELGWRARMRGLRIVLDPRADVLHDYLHERNPKKNYYMERNRLIFVSTAYSLRLLVLLAPVLLSAEAGLLLVAARERWLRDKLAGWAWCLRNARWILRHRRRLQSERLVPDRELARFFTPVVDPGMIDVPAPVRALNPLVAGYWGLVRRLL